MNIDLIRKYLTLMGHKDCRIIPLIALELIPLSGVSLILYLLLLTFSVQHAKYTANTMGRNIKAQMTIVQ